MKSLEHICADHWPHSKKRQRQMGASLGKSAAMFALLSWVPYLWAVSELINAFGFVWVILPVMVLFELGFNPINSGDWLLKRELKAKGFWKDVYDA